MAKREEPEEWLQWSKRHKLRFLWKHGFKAAGGLVVLKQFYHLESTRMLTLQMHYGPGDELDDWFVLVTPSTANDSEEYLASVEQALTATE